MESSKALTPEMIKFNNFIYKSNKDLIAGIDKVEDWTSSNDDAIKKIKEVVSSIQEELENNKTINFDNFVSALAYFNTSHVMAVLAELEEHTPMLVMKLLQYIISIQESGSSLVQRLFAERLLYTYRISIIPIIFSKERVEALNQTIKQMN
jgi:hypothetical protein